MRTNPPLAAKTLTSPVTRHQPSRRAVRAVVLLAAFVLLLVATAPASAAQSCGRKVIDDWWDGRIDGTYELHCYDDAIEILPRDVRDYSSAEDDIKRALQSAMRSEAAPPNQDGPAGDDEPTTTTTTSPPGNDPPVKDPGPVGTEAFPPTEPTSSASSLPIPLLILAGLALLLVAGGSAGYLIRRAQSGQIPPPPV